LRNPLAGSKYPEKDHNNQVTSLSGEMVICIWAFCSFPDNDHVGDFNEMIRSLLSSAFARFYCLPHHLLKITIIIIGENFGKLREW